MIYADPSFLFSLYAWDDNSAVAVRTYASDARRPLWLTPWQRFELRNAVRLAVHRFKRSGQPVPFQPGNVFRDIQEDFDSARITHQDIDWRKTLRLVEDLSQVHTEDFGAGAVDLWHVASAILLEADTFWTFDKEQFEVAKATGRFASVPRLRA
jgi:predicted nucleic acid-binding protein